MIRIAIAWSALFCPQDADRSTPESAAESFLRLLDKSSLEVEYWRKLLWEADELSDSYRTPAVREKYKNWRGRLWRFADNVWETPDRLKVKDKVLSQGVCVLQAERDMKVRMWDAKTRKVKEYDIPVSYTFHF